MTAELIVLFLASFLIVPLSWALPRDHAMDGVAAFSALILGLLAPMTLLWLVAATLAAWGAARRLEASSNRHADLTIVTVLLVGALLTLRSLRHRPDRRGLFHVASATCDLRRLMRRLPAPSLRQFSHYLFFLPGMAIGPINRFQSFQRSIDRRRFDAQALANGAERVLLGLAQATILGGAFDAPGQDPGRRNSAGRVFLRSGPPRPAPGSPFISSLRV